VVLTGFKAVPDRSLPLHNRNAQSTLTAVPSSQFAPNNTALNLAGELSLVPQEHCG
jgi:hypothetical protein